MGIPWLTIAVSIATSMASFWLTSRSEHASEVRRLRRLKVRGSTTIEDWRAVLPTIPFDSFVVLLPVIAKGLKVPQHYLRPDDAFDGILSRKDRFWSFVMDDDDAESIADAFEEEFGYRPDGGWIALRDIILDTSELVNHDG